MSKDNYVDIGTGICKVWVESYMVEIQTVTKIGELDYVVRIRPTYPEDVMDITLIRKPRQEILK